MGKDQPATEPTVKCECGEELKPGEDQCWSCLGEEIPKRWDFDSPSEKHEYIKERVADLSRVGTEDWKEEMRALWPYK